MLHCNPDGDLSKGGFIAPLCMAQKYKGRKRKENTPERSNIVSNFLKQEHVRFRLYVCYATAYCSTCCNDKNI